MRPAPIPDLTHRLDPAALPELMDEPCAYEAFRDTVRDLARLNRLLLAYGPTLRFLNTALSTTSAAKPPATPVHILDVGFGGGDTLRRIARWARRHNKAVQLTGIDLNPHATRAATELCAGSPLFAQIQLLTGDVFTHPATQSPDLVLSSLVTHHMEDSEITHFLRWMETHAVRGWFISDLIRSPRAYRLFRPFASILRMHPFVRHDGLVSIRRAFREPDWQRLLGAAGIPANEVQLHRSGIGRLCLTRVRREER